ncbi:MAG: ArsR family transcriptional regulator [Candidatus Altiarchaeota archaeon]|nr:ArsR family transcriptional regulator [Candidatus Altiarchaeota archaeon]
MEDKITLDRETFKALAIDSRVSILKKLDERFQLTLTDLATELDMAPSTIKEHLDKLVSAGLIQQLDKGMKWKYYRLTSKGEKILNPHEKRVWIVLTVSVLALFAAVYSFLARLQSIVSLGFIAEEARENVGFLGTGGIMQAADKVSTTLAHMPPRADEELYMMKEAGGAVLENVPDSAWNATSDVMGNVTTTLAQIPGVVEVPYAELMLVIVLVLVVGICVGYLIKRKRIL